MCRTFQLCALNERVNQLCNLLSIRRVQSFDLLQPTQQFQSLSATDSLACRYCTQQFIGANPKRGGDLGNNYSEGRRAVAFVVGNHPQRNIHRIGQLLLRQTRTFAQIGQAFAEFKLGCVSGIRHAMRGFRQKWQGSEIINYQHWLDLKCTINVHSVHKIVVQFMNIVAVKANSEGEA